MGTENIQITGGNKRMEIKHLCTLYTKAIRGKYVPCCCFCPKRDNCPSELGKCLNSPDKCGYYADALETDASMMYAKKVGCCDDTDGV